MTRTDSHLIQSLSTLYVHTAAIPGRFLTLLAISKEFLWVSFADLSQLLRPTCSTIQRTAEYQKIAAIPALCASWACTIQL